MAAIKPERSELERPDRNGEQVDAPHLHAQCGQKNIDATSSMTRTSSNFVTPLLGQQALEDLGT